MAWYGGKGVSGSEKVEVEAKENPDETVRKQIVHAAKEASKWCRQLEIGDDIAEYWKSEEEVEDAPETETVVEEDEFEDQGISYTLPPLFSTISRRRREKIGNYTLPPPPPCFRPS